MHPSSLDLAHSSLEARYRGPRNARRNKTTWPAVKPPKALGVLPTLVRGPAHTFHQRVGNDSRMERESARSVG